MTRTLAGKTPGTPPNNTPRPPFAFCSVQDLLDAFEREVARVPDILECHLMAGAADYLIKIMAEDTEDFARIHRRYLARLPGVRQMQSSFALRTVVQTTALAV